MGREADISQLLACRQKPIAHRSPSHQHKRADRRLDLPPQLADRASERRRTRAAAR
jgi:hypothetical protein